LKDYPEAWLCNPLYAEQVENLMLTRRQREVQRLPGTDNSGRILVVLNGLDTGMGEGTPASNGVIDDAYLPPWDTWFALIVYSEHKNHPYSPESILLAWIPAELTSVVQCAIEVAASQPIRWLDEPWFDDLYNPATHPWGKVAVPQPSFWTELQQQMSQPKPA